MKKSYIRKSIAMLVIISILSVFIYIPAGAADSNIIYETSTKQTITSGAVLENIVRFTKDGWLNISVLHVDLSNSNIKVNALANATSIHTRTTVKDLAAASGAVAATNAGFFIYDSNTALANPIGSLVQSGQVSSMSTDINQDKDTFATLSISKLNEMMYNYWKTNMTLIAPNGQSTPVGRYNRTYAGHLDFTILDGKFTKQTIGTTNGSSDCVEMLVDNGKVVEIRQSQPATAMPANGYVVVTRQAGGQFLLSNFQVGDPVSLSIQTTPDWSNLQTAITGGAMLVKDGQVQQTFSHIPEGTHSTRNPRTAVGSSKDGKELMMVTVDGRASGSVGMTLSELAQFMSEIGAYNAMNFDGGGSTSMVARTPDSQVLETVNKPSENRKISTALGIFSIAPPSALDGLYVDTSENNVFVNTSRTFTVKGFDRYYNPLSIDASKVKWSVTGVKGTFIGSTFYPKTVGVAKIKASLGNVSGTFDVNVLSAPAQLMLNSTSVNLPLNGTKTFTVSGRNKNGYYASINPADVKWTVKGSIGTMSKNILVSKGQGVGYVEASIGSTNAFCTVSVKTETTKTLDAFEKSNGTFTSYPTTVEGSYGISQEQKHGGKSSGKLTYNFPAGEDNRAAYITYPDGGLKLDPNTKTLGIWVYNEHANSDWLGAWVMDAKGAQHTVYFTKTLNVLGWSHLEASIDDIDNPTKLARIYLVQTNPDEDAGSIYLDDLTATTSVYPAIDPSKAPKDTTPLDDALKSVPFKKSSNSIRFSVFGQTSEPNTALEKSLITKLAGKLKTTVDAAAFVGDSTHAVAKTVGKPAVTTNDGYKSFDLAGSRFIQLDMSKKGLRLSDSDQWQWMLDQLNSFTGSNVFLFLAGDPESFNDQKETDLFKNILSQYKQKSKKNVWVFYDGAKNASYMDKGIKYISTPGLDVSGLTAKNIAPAKYILVTVKGNVVTYEYKPVA